MERTSTLMGRFFFTASVMLLPIKDVSGAGTRARFLVEMVALGSSNRDS